jgi:hypothetical protein
MTPAMSSQEKHPHIEHASDEQLPSLLEAKAPVVRQLYLDTHRLVVDPRGPWSLNVGPTRPWWPDNYFRGGSNN